MNIDPTGSFVNKLAKPKFIRCLMFCLKKCLFFV